MRFLVVEDDMLVAEALKLLLAEQSYGVDLAPTGSLALKLLESFEYDLVILDLLLPDTDGVALCQRLRAQGHATPILLLTGQNNVEKKAIALNAGVDDYVVKPFDRQELLARVQALLRRGSGQTAPVLTWGALRLNPSTRHITYNGQEITLTPKEYALLELLLRHSNRTFSAKVILDRIWAAEEYPGEEAVRTHIKGLRQKLRSAGAPAELIETIHRVGYRLNPAAYRLPEMVPPRAAAPLKSSSPTPTNRILALAPETMHSSLYQALNHDETIQLVMISEYADLWPALKTYTPALLILSYDLDAEKSLDISRTLRQRAPWQRLPIIMVLSVATINAIQQVFVDGASDVVVQPILGPELSGRIARQMRLSNS
ncbi:response regulator [Nodosilinea sp. FACHB-131]|uniref:response regulator n=1 Tax=Cyanophyceae TaxID=3028117 RepID=UPI001686F829|nr:response regulator [Nodosilinea sp. FACHB-131]MBD1876711.1 response regulator [Nodosilinea sp. FACHB-131]